jgi:hypothetical protein
MHRMICCMHDLEFHRQNQSLILPQIQHITPDSQVLHYWKRWILPMIQWAQKQSPKTEK